MDRGSGADQFQQHATSKQGRETQLSCFQHCLYVRLCSRWRIRSPGDRAVEPSICARVLIKAPLACSPGGPVGGFVGSSFTGFAGQPRIPVPRGTHRDTDRDSPGYRGAFTSVLRRQGYRTLKPNGNHSLGDSMRVSSPGSAPTGVSGSRGVLGTPCTPSLLVIWSASKKSWGAEVGCLSRRARLTRFGIL